MSKHHRTYSDKCKVEDDLSYPRHEELLLPDSNADLQRQPPLESTHCDVIHGEHSSLRDVSTDSEVNAQVETLMHSGHLHGGTFSSDVLNMSGAVSSPGGGSGGGSSSSRKNSDGGGNGFSGIGPGQVVKERTYRCRHCSFQVQNKVESWRHARTHIKPEKMLECKLCEFVTEYRHHLEYHVRNHYNVKPYQCSKCSYRCVNQSMLNSHLKSHSSTCHYRCQDCNYATKYCHSLKTHLRKNGHRSAGVTAHGLSVVSKQQHLQMQQHQPHLQQQSLSSTHLSSTKPRHMLPPPPISSHVPQPPPPAEPSQPPLFLPPGCLPWPPHQLFGANSTAAAAAAATAAGDSNYLMILRRQAAMAAAAAAAAAAAFRQSPIATTLLPLPPPPFFLHGASAVGSSTSVVPPLFFHPPPTISPMSAQSPMHLVSSSTSTMQSMPPGASWSHRQYHQHFQQLQSQPPPHSPMLQVPLTASVQKSLQALPSEQAVPPHLAASASTSASALAPLDLRVAKPKVAAQ